MKRLTVYLTFSLTLSVGAGLLMGAHTIRQVVGTVLLGVAFGLFPLFFDESLK